MKKKLSSILILLMAVVLLPATAPATTQVFFTDFNSGAPPQFSGFTTTESVQGFANKGPLGNQFGGTFLRNPSGNQSTAPTPTILTLSGLPAHTSIDINFLFGAIDSWDSTDGIPAPDYFNVTVDAGSVLQATFNNASGTVNHPDSLLRQHLGWWSSYPEQAYLMNLTNIPHTASNLTIAFFASGAGWQGDGDESWAIENLEVRVTEVTAPLPGTMFLMSSGVLGLIGWRLRRKS